MCVELTCSCGELGSYIMANTNKPSPSKGPEGSQKPHEFTTLSLNSLLEKYTKKHSTKTQYGWWEKKMKKLQAQMLDWNSYVHAGIWSINTCSTNKTKMFNCDADNPRYFNYSGKFYLVLFISAKKSTYTKCQIHGTQNYLGPLKNIGLAMDSSSIFCDKH